MATNGHGGRDDLVEPEGVNAGGPVARRETERPTAEEAAGSGPNGDRGMDPGGHPAAQDNGELPWDNGELPRDNGELLSGADPEPTRRPPQPGQELSAGEG